MAKYARENSNISFVDVWTPMLNKRKVKEDLFVEDGLHMNEKGYDIWYNTIKEFMDWTFFILSEFEKMVQTPQGF